MRLVKQTALSALLIATVFSAGARAQGIPVYDAAGFTQMITQLEQMSQDYQKQLEQLNEAMKQTEALTGPRGLGDLANSPLEQQLRTYLPLSWEDTMNMIEAGNLQGSAMGTQNIYADLNGAFDPLYAATVMPDTSGYPSARALERGNSTTLAALAASEQAYNSIEARLQTYRQLLERLNTTQDLKESADLQARIAAENGMLMTEIMRLQTIAIQHDASSAASQMTNQRRAFYAHGYDADKARAAIDTRN